MKILIIGWSDSAVRRVVPACLSLGIEGRNLLACPDLCAPARTPVGIPTGTRLLS